MLKLLKPGFDSQMLIAESTKTAAVHAAGGPAPDVSDLVNIDGRSGILIERIHGNSMLDAILANEDGLVSHIMAFADLHAQVLGTPLDADLPDVKDFLASRIDNANLPLGQRTAAKDRMIGLPNGDATLHGDYHPGNIIVTPDGPTVIDWGEASRGDAAADIARTLLLLTPESVSGAVPNPGNIASFVNRVRQRLQGAVHSSYRCHQQARSQPGGCPWSQQDLARVLLRKSALLRAEVARLTSESRRT